MFKKQVAEACPFTLSRGTWGGKDFATLPDTGEDNGYDTTEERLTAYFSPNKNALYERYDFGQTCQEQNETID